MLSSPSMFNAPSTVRESKPDAVYIQPTLNHALRIWWAYYWPTSLAAGMIIFCGAFWLRLLYERVAISAHTLRISLIVLPYAATAAIGVLIFRYILGKRFRHFRIALLPAAGGSEATPLRPVWRRTIRVWWTFTWRSVIYGIVLGLLVGLSLGVVMAMLREMGGILAAFVPIIQGLIIGGAVGLFVIYSNILDEKFGDFKVVLLPREVARQTPMAANAPPQPQVTT